MYFLSYFLFTSSGVLVLCLLTLKMDDLFVVIAILLQKKVI